MRGIPWIGNLIRKSNPIQSIGSIQIDSVFANVDWTSTQSNPVEFVNTPIDLESENTKIKAEKAEIEARDAEHLKQVMEDNAKLKTRIKELEKNNGVITKLKSKNAELKARVVKL